MNNYPKKSVNRHFWSKIAVFSVYFSVLSMSLLVLGLGSNYVYAQSEQSINDADYDSHKKNEKRIKTLKEDIESANSFIKNKNQLLKDAGNSLSSEDSKALLKELIRSAKERRDDMRELLSLDPKSFLLNVVSEKDKNNLPESVKNYFEQRADTAGTLEVLVTESLPDEPHMPNRYFINEKESGGNSKGNKTKKTEVFLSEEINIQSGSEVEIEGYIFEGKYVASVGGYTDSPAFADSGTKGLTINSLTPIDGATGQQRLLVVLVDFNDTGTDRPFTSTQAHNFIFNGQFANFYNEQSYGSMSWTGTVTDWYKLNRNAGAAPCMDVTMPELTQIVNARGVDMTQYDRVAILVHYNNNGKAGGCSLIGKGYYDIAGAQRYVSMAWIGMGAKNTTTGLYWYQRPSIWGQQPFSWTSLDYLLSHELGHSIGMTHARGYDCGTQSITGTCTDIEYGDSFDVMGQSAYSLHSNGLYKERLGWIPANRKLSITTSGRYTVNAIEYSSGTAFAEVVLPGQNGPQTVYELEFRQPYGFDAKLDWTQFYDNTTGLLVRGIHGTDIYGAEATRLIDATPTANDWFQDFTNMSIPVGGTFTDSANYLSITPVSINYNGVPSITFDVAITPPVCTRGTPNLLEVMSNATVNSDNYYWATGRFVSTDNIYCPSSQYRFSPDPQSLPLGWTYTDATDYVAHGAEGWISTKISIPDNVDPGIYNITYVVEQIATGNKSYISKNIEVLPTPRITSIQPIANRGEVVTLFGQNFSPETYTRVLLTVPSDGNEYWLDLVSSSTNKIQFVMPQNIPYTSTSLPAGKYKVRVYTSEYYTNKVDITVGEPNTLVLNASPRECNDNPNSISLRWTGMSANAVGYKIMRNGVEVYTTAVRPNSPGLVGSSIAGGWADNNIPHNTTYTYTIVEILSGGATGATSNASTATTVDFCKVKNVDIELGSCAGNNADTAMLRWSHPAWSANRYSVYRNGSKIGEIGRLDLQQYGFADKGLQSGTVYRYEIVTHYDATKTYGYYDVSWSGIGASATSTGEFVATTPTCANTHEAPASYEARVILGSCSFAPDMADDVILNWSFPGNTNNYIKTNVYRSTGELISSRIKGASDDRVFVDDARVPSIYYGYQLSSVYLVNGVEIESPKTPVFGTTSLPLCNQSGLGGEGDLPSDEEEVKENISSSDYVE